MGVGLGSIWWLVAAYSKGRSFGVLGQMEQGVRESLGFCCAAFVVWDFRCLGQTVSKSRLFRVWELGCV